LAAWRAACTAGASSSARCPSALRPW
jgi:hypothetical protein